MPDLTTEWLGLSLRSPLVVAASPVSRDAEAAAAAVRAGAGAVILPSLFEEELIAEELALHRLLDAEDDRDAESGSLLPPVVVTAAGPYLAHLRALAARLDVPVIASLNGVTPGGWTDHAAALEAAGAAAIELNLYEVATDPDEPGDAVEARQAEVVRAVVAAVRVPVTVKIGPSYASVPAFLRRIEAAGARGATLFNRFWQPDVDPAALSVARKLDLSDPRELPLRLHGLALAAPWDAALARLHRRRLDGGGCGQGDPLRRAGGAGGVRPAAARGRGGWAPSSRNCATGSPRMATPAPAEIRGLLARHPGRDPAAWERLNYIRMLGSWQPPPGWR
jgi:dihydroorotate dehydrogenase (fumarate)